LRDFLIAALFKTADAIGAFSKLLEDLLAPEDKAGVADMPVLAPDDDSSLDKRKASYHTFQHCFFIFLLTCSASLANCSEKIRRQKRKSDKCSVAGEGRE